ncbi:MAG: heavy metal translocating P-type ATPase [Opitutales bacterium]
MSSTSSSSKAQDRKQDVSSVSCAACCAVDGNHGDDADLETLIFAAVIGGQSMVWGLAVNLTPPDLFSKPYWMLHGWLAASAFIVAISLGRPLVKTLFANLAARRLSVEGLFFVTALGGFVASLIATFTGVGDVYYEVVAIVLAIYTVGKRIGRRTREKIAAEVKQAEQAFHFCTLIEDDGQHQRVPVDEVVSGSRVLVGAGEQVTVDGIVEEGNGWLDASMVNGEPEPIYVAYGESVKAGSWLRSGELRVKVERAGGSRELDSIFASLREAFEHASQIEKWTDRLTQRFLPFVLTVSLLTGVAWTLISGWAVGLFNAMAVLLVACPCALGLATPIAVWRGLVRLASKGIVSRDVHLLDALGTTREIFWDKTGTLTETRSEIVETRFALSQEWSESALLDLVSTVESAFDHPIAETLQAVGESRSDWTLKSPEWNAGSGIRVEVKTGQEQVHQVRIGAMSALMSAGVELDETLAIGGLPEGKRIALAVDGRVLALFIIRETLRSDALQTLSDLKALGVRSTILTGDPEPVWGNGIGMARMHSGLSAMTKAEFVERSAENGSSPVLIGDGINDAPGMHVAAASISMASGTPLTQAVGSGVLVTNRLSALPDAIRLSRETLRRIHQNLYFSAGYNAIGIGLAAMGWLHPVVAAVLMLGSSFWVSWRAVR